MTLTSTVTKVTHIGDGSTTAVPITFKFWDDSDIKAISTVDATAVETTLILNTDYTLSGGSGATGTLTLTPATATGNTVTVKSSRADTQDTSLPAGGSFPSTTVEAQMDKLTRLIQQRSEELGRAIKLAESSSTTGLTFPEPVADNIIGWNAAGTDLSNITVATISTSIDTLLSGLASGDFLKYDGTNWINRTASEVRTDLDVLQNVFTTKGDILVQGTSSEERLAVGSNGQVLEADSTQSGGVKWAAKESQNNLLINSNFIVAQRGTSFTSATTPANNDDTYLLDRWILLSDGNDVVDVTQQTDAGLGNYSYIRADVETVSKKFGFLQIIEQKDVLSVIGGSDTVSLSFKAKTSDNAKIATVKAAVLSWAGTADAPTSDIVSAWGSEGTTPTWATSWTAENTPADLSVTTSEATYTIENITIDTASVANVAVFIWCDDVATNDTLGTTLDITDVKLEKGASATTYTHPQIGSETDKCLRFYEQRDFTTANGEAVGSGFYNSSTVCEVPVLFDEKRSNPSVTLSAGDTFSLLSGGASIALTGASVVVVGKQSFRIQGTTAAQTIDDPVVLLNDVGFDAFIKIDAEL